MFSLKAGRIALSFELGHDISNNVVCAIRVHAVCSEPLLVECSMIVKLLSQHYLEFISLTGGCRGSYESTLVKIPHCWKSHDMAHFSCVMRKFD